MEKVFCAVSKLGTYYNEKNKMLFVRGWCLSGDGYDEVKINGKNAKCGLPRLDVYKNFPQFDNRNSGFQFEAKCYDFNKKISIEILKNNNVIYMENKEVNSINYEEFNWEKEVVLVGLDHTIQQFYFKNRKKVKVKYCLDDNLFGSFFVDKPIYKILPEKIQEGYIYIVGATKKEEWCSKLRNEGMHEFNDFYICTVLEHLIRKKKMIVLHGNCHMTRIANAFQKTKVLDDFFYMKFL